MSALPAPLELLSGGAFAVGVEPLDAWTEWFPREAASTAAWIAERVRGWQQSSGARVATGST